jgi:hypothetical protein
LVEIEPRHWIRRLSWLTLGGTGALFLLGALPLALFAMDPLTGIESFRLGPWSYTVTLDSLGDPPAGPETFPSAHSLVLVAVVIEIARLALSSRRPSRTSPVRAGGPPLPGE